MALIDIIDVISSKNYHRLPSAHFTALSILLPFFITRLTFFSLFLLSFRSFFPFEHISSVLFCLFPSHTPNRSAVYISFCFYMCHSNDQISDLLMSLLCWAAVSAVRFRCNTMPFKRLCFMLYSRFLSNDIDEVHCIRSPYRSLCYRLTFITTISRTN